MAYRETVLNWLQHAGVDIPLAQILIDLGLLAGLILLATVIISLGRSPVLNMIEKAVRKSSFTWDDVFLDRALFRRMLKLIMPLLLVSSAPMMIEIGWLVLRIGQAWLVLTILMVIDAILSACVDLYRKTEQAHTRPIHGYVQVVKLFVNLAGGILIITMMMNKNPVVVLSFFGASSAILLLIFKDTLLGLVASIQLTSNRLIHIGDWIEMSKYGADGDVVDIGLLTVKVRNWDKTYSTIPTYALVSDSFKNWRGMSESGGRRIKRSIHIDMNTVRFLDSNMLERYHKIDYIETYLTDKIKELEAWNTDAQTDQTCLVNGRRLTNLGTFRAYLEAYLRHHPKVHQDMTFLVRHLEPTERGLPIEIYVFSNDQVWAHYEGIQADIFDHILAVIPEFDLRVFQSPSGSDVQLALAKLCK